MADTKHTRERLSEQLAPGFKTELKSRLAQNNVQHNSATVDAPSPAPLDDIELFRSAVRDARPHAARAEPPAPPKQPPIARFTRADQQQVLQESLLPTTDPALLDTGDELSFRRDHLPYRVLQRLRRGEFAVHAELDLHGLTAIEARAALSEFIHESLLHQHRCVRIVHGKGKRSGARGPVLKNVVNLWLRHCDPVQAFGSARQVDGGSGAVYVLLA